jgi:hypothetical protein
MRITVIIRTMHTSLSEAPGSRPMKRRYLPKNRVISRMRVRS